MSLPLRSLVFSLVLLAGTVGVLPPVRVAVAQAAWFGQVTCNGSNNLLLALDDGEAFVGSFIPCPVCTPTDTLNWTPAPCGNILASAGRTGERLLLLFNLSGVCGFLNAVTDRGFVLMGTDTQCWQTAMESRSVFQVLGLPPEEIVGAGTDNGSQLFLLTASGSVLRVQYQGAQFQFVTNLGKFSEPIPTPALRSTWGQLKGRYR